jgi:hypothetical protein
VARNATVRWSLVAVLAATYVAFSAAALAGLALLRSNVLSQETSPAAAESWQRWKAETERISHERGPIARRAVTTDEPPALILLRDYFGNVVMAVEAIVAGVFVFLVMVFWSRLRPVDGNRRQRRLE